MKRQYKTPAWYYLAGFLMMLSAVRHMDYALEYLGVEWAHGVLTFVCPAYLVFKSIF